MGVRGRRSCHSLFFRACSAEPALTTRKGFVHSTVTLASSSSQTDSLFRSTFTERWSASSTCRSHRNKGPPRRRRRETQEQAVIQRSHVLSGSSSPSLSLPVSSSILEQSSISISRRRAAKAICHSSGDCLARHLHYICPDLQMAVKRSCPNAKMRQGVLV